MKKILALSILLTFLGSCAHYKMRDCGGCACDKSKPCASEGKDMKKEDCADCKKSEQSK